MKNKVKETPKMDLHNTKHQEVQTKLDKFLGEHILNGTNEAIVVTGNSDKMKVIVRNILKDYNLIGETSELNSGILTIKLQ